MIDTVTGWEVDLIVRRARPYSLVEFDRRREAELEGVRVYVAAPEDTILTKLEWAAEGESERQLRDVRAIVRTSGEGLDRRYLEDWADELGVRRALDELLGADQ